MKDLILLSGGLDSTTALALCHARNTASRAVTVDYGQRHDREVTAAKAIAARYGVPLHVLDFRSWGAALPGSALTDGGVPVPHGHYADASMAVTVVPNRNATLIMAAAGIAAAHGCQRVVTAVHAGDHPVYADCRPQFIASARQVVELATDGKVGLFAPFLHDTKAEIARIAQDYGVPLGLTWSCYEGGTWHCGRCGTCVERREAFEQAGVLDPTTYACDQAPTGATGEPW